MNREQRFLAILFLIPLGAFFGVKLLSLLCNTMLKSSNVEGHQLKKLVKTKTPIYTGLPHSNTVFSVHKKDCVFSKTVF